MLHLCLYLPLQMGLGKTAQTIVFLGVLTHAARQRYEAALAQQAAGIIPQGPRTRPRPPTPHIVVCPASLLENWQRELRMWCPGLR